MFFHFTKEMMVKTHAPSLPTQDDVDPLYSWRVNYIQYGKHDLLIFMNDAALYAVLVDDPQMETPEEFLAEFEDQLERVMLRDQINPEVIDRYLRAFPEVDIVKNSNPQKNNELDQLFATVRDIWGKADDVSMSQYVNNQLIDETHNDTPTEHFMKELSQFGLPLRKTHAFDLLVILQLPKGSTRRKIRVSANFTFDDLHWIIQEAMGWSGLHLYKFEFYRQNDYDPFIELLGLKDSEYHPDATLAKDVKLIEMIPKYQRIFYTYNFTDWWHMKIQIMGEMFDCDELLPVLLRGSGATPSEQFRGMWEVEEYFKKNAKVKKRGDQSDDDDLYWLPYDFDETAECVRSAMKDPTAYAKFADMFEY